MRQERIIFMGTPEISKIYLQFAEKIKSTYL